MYNINFFILYDTNIEFMMANIFLRYLFNKFVSSLFFGHDFINALLFNIIDNQC